MVLTQVQEKTKKASLMEPLSLEKINSKQITIGVVGLGYVGLPLSLVFGEAQVKVIGFDIDSGKVQQLNEGDSYLSHLDSNVLKNQVNRGFFKASCDFSDVSYCDVIIICVPTPLTKHLEPDLEFVIRTCEDIAPYLKPHSLVSLESTTWPGTTEEVVMPLLEKGSGLKVGHDLYLSFSPEREDPGNPDFNTKNIPKVLGAINEQSLVLSKAVYELAIDQIVTVKSTKEAEASKLLENIFRSVNIALVNEMKIILDRMNIDVWDVINAASTKPFGYMPFWPGPGLGGHCIPIDPFYLTWKAKESGLSTRFIELAGEINRHMPNYVVGKVQDCLNDHHKPLRKSRILVLGLAYKPDLGDMRESPSLEILELLEDKGAIVDYHDPFLPFIPKNRDYPQLVGKKSSKISADFDCFILATKHKIFDLDYILSIGVPIIDTRHAFPDSKLVYRA